MNSYINKDLLSCFFSLIKYNKLPHAILLNSSNAGTALDIAADLSCAIVCEADGDSPCFNCNACKKVKNKIHPDVIVVEGEKGARGFHIDKVREIISSSYIMPNDADSKIYILKDVQNMTLQAQNALLKILEDPPSFVYFILICDNNFNLIDTIKSRVQTYKISGDESHEPKTGESEDISHNMIYNIEKRNFSSLLFNTEKLLKDREIFYDTLDLLEAMLSNKLKDQSIKTNKWNNSNTEDYDLCLNKILPLLEVIKQCKDYLNKNANKNLLATWLVSNINKIISFKEEN